MTTYFIIATSLAILLLLGVLLQRSLLKEQSKRLCKYEARLELARYKLTQLKDFDALVQSEEEAKTELSNLKLVELINKSK